jgi:hypothetical protein
VSGGETAHITSAAGVDQLLRVNSKNTHILLVTNTSSLRRPVCHFLGNQANTKVSYKTANQNVPAMNSGVLVSASNRKMALLNIIVLIPTRNSPSSYKTSMQISEDLL